MDKTLESAPTSITLDENVDKEVKERKVKDLVFEEQDCRLDIIAKTSEFLLSMNNLRELSAVSYEV